MKLHHHFGLALLLASCGQQEQQQPVSSENSASIPEPPPATVVSNNTVAAAPKPQPMVDPKSTEAATELVQRFADLLNERKFDEAYMLLGPGAPPRSEFDRRFATISNLKASVGHPGEQEGAAGSIYISIPLTVSGSVGGKQQTWTATAIMRRVNDVPGSTEAQRRWHIERIDWGDA